MLQPLPHGVAGPYDELICFGALLFGGFLYLGLYFVSGRRLRDKRDQQDQN